MNLETLINKTRQKRSNFDPLLIKKAYSFAEKKHYGQKRISGEDFIVHPLSVAIILAEIGLDDESICAALLHDTLEDTETTKQEIVDNFGPKIAELVDGVTKLGTIDFSKISKSNIQDAKFQAELEHLRRFFVAMAKDIRVVIIKLADRLHNMRTLEKLSEDDRKRISRETLEIFAPLADRLGMGSVKAELEDIAFQYSNPTEYRHICNLVETGNLERKHFIAKMLRFIKAELEKEGIDAQVEGRAKHIYSIYRKMQKVDNDFSQIHDLIAIRVIVDSVENCYKVLGIMHKHFKPLIYKIKDYIAVPKPNGYQSLHTTVFGLNGKITEIQIRTYEMHEEAEKGVAAHWHYNETKQDKAYKGKSSYSESSRTAWVKSLGSMQKNMSTTEEFAEMLNIDIFNDRVFVFSPKGDIFDLPVDATPVDFAYGVHSAIGHRCRGAKVNGKIVTLDHKLQNRDVVEVILAPKNDKGGPSRGWLESVKTVKARQNIRSWFRGLNREENLFAGEKLLREELAFYNLAKSGLSDEQQSLVIGNAGWKNWDDVLVAIGKGSVTARWVVKKIIGQKALAKEDLGNNNKSVNVANLDLERLSAGKKIQNLSGVLVRYAECCKPTRNDEVKGFITQGYGITIHRADCRNLLTSSKEKVIDINIKTIEPVRVYIEIYSKDRPGLIHEIAGVINEENSNIKAMQNQPAENGTTIIDIEIELDYLEKMTDLLPKILKIEGIISVINK